MRGSIVLVMLLASVTALPAWRWPVSEPVVRTEFAEFRMGTVSRGIEVGTTGQPVFPVADGVVVATSDVDVTLNNGLGNFVIVEHPEAFRSIYAHLEAGELPPVGSEVGEDTRIGVTGTTGQTVGQGLFLMVIDLKSGDYVNPRLLLPDLPDNVRPFITNVRFLRSDGRSFSPDEELPQGRYSVSVRVADRASVTSGEAGPYTLGMFAAGQTVLSVEFDRITPQPDGLRIGAAGIAPDDLVAADRTFVLGEVELGGAPVDIEIVATDFAGNQRVWSAELRGAE
jgi:hypothetical protein